MPILGLDRFGRRPLLMWGTFGQAVSMALVAALLSFHGTSVERSTATASIAFLITVRQFLRSLLKCSLSWVSTCFLLDLVCSQFHGCMRQKSFRCMYEVKELRWLC